MDIEANISPTENRENNIYARNLKGDIIHISVAPSGELGYYCLGCEKELQAVQRNIAHYKPYFRHVHNAEQGERKCTYSDETYRHKLAKRILLQNLYIKVPPVYKYPPKKQEGLAHLLKESEIIKAHSARPEVLIYEDDLGNVKWDSNIEVDEKHLIVKPDIVFFDSSGQPMLLIELVATHKVDNEKKIKLRRLGIDCIQVKIPRDSPESIENSFNITQHTKWIYNYEESSAQYVSVSQTDTEGIPPIDSDQRNLFEETFACRMSQTGNLIRAIDKCVESQYYRSIEESFGQEIRRTASNTEEHQSRLDNLRAEHKKRVIDGFEQQIQDLEREEERFELEEGDFERHYKDLDTRYKSKKSEIDGTTKDVERAIYGAVETDGGAGEFAEKRRREIVRLTGELRQGYVDKDEEIRRIEDEIRKLEEDEGRLHEHFRKETRSIEEEFERLTDREEQEIERIGDEEKQLSLQEKNIEDDVRRAIDLEESDLPREFGEEDERIEKNAEGLREQADKIIKSRISAGNTELHTRVRKLLDARGLYDDFYKAQILYRRYRKAYDACKSNTYDHWVE